MQPKLYIEYTKMYTYLSIKKKYRIKNYQLISWLNNDLFTKNIFDIIGMLQNAKIWRNSWSMS